MITVGLLVLAACTSTATEAPVVTATASPATVVSNAPPLVSATPVATETPIATDTPGPPPASATISTWTRLPASEAFRAATMDRVVAGPAGVLALGSRDDAAGAGFAGWWSSDGYAWTRSDATGTNYAGDAVALADGFVIVGKIGDVPGAEGAMTWRSPDGTGWSSSPVDSLRTGPFAAAWIEGRLTLFAIRAPSGGEPTMAWSSDDLESWTSGLLGGDGYSTAGGLSVLADGSGLAFGSWSTEPQDAAPFPGPAGFWRSSDGRTWQKTADDADLRNAWVIGVAQAPGSPIVAVGQRWNPNLSPDQPYTNAAWTSPDGDAWDRATWPSSLEQAWTPSRVVAAGGGYLVLGADRSGNGATALIARSVDGRTWTAIDPPIAFEGGQANDLVAVGDHLVVVGGTVPPEGTAADAVVWIGPATVE